jgi:hypothetical protein
MAYCVITDVQEKMQHIPAFTVSTKPTLAQVTGWIDQVSAGMDAFFSALGILTPVTNATKLTVLKPICVNGVAAEVYRSLEMENERADMHQRLYDNALKQIERNPAIINTAVSQSAPAGQDYGSVARSFTREGREW